MSEVKKLKPVTPLNDFVAILKNLKLPDGIEVDKEQLERISNEGIVVGVGPDARDVVNLGDVVVFTPKPHLTMTPLSGGYGGRQVVVLHKADLMVRIGISTDYEFSDGVGQ